jgi:hypothetical protein
MRPFQMMNVPDDPKQLPQFLRQFQRALLEAMNESGVTQTYIGTAPTRPQDGIYFAEAGVLGVNRGEYRYDAATATYTYLG